MGILYQYWNIIAWLFATCVPLVGTYIGDYMIIVVGNIFEDSRSKTGIPKQSYHRPGRKGFPGIACFMYFYLHLQTYQELLGLVTPLQKKYKSSESKCPTLFIWNGDGKKLKFFGQPVVDR